MDNDPEFTRMVRDAVTQAALKESVAPDTAIAIGRLTVDQISLCHGGQTIYLPRCKREKRNKQILREWNGRNVDELCCKYRIGKSTLYRIINSKA